MANIGTIQLRCFRRPGKTQRVRSRTLRRRVCPAGSYCVEIWSRDSLREGVVDFQYGARWCSTLDLEENWHHLQETFSSIWVRAYDSGGDEDRFDAYGASCEHRFGPYYGFDSLELELADEGSVRLGPDLSQAGPRLWRCQTPDGRYRCGNARLGWHEPTMPSPTTPVAYVALSNWPEAFPTELCAFLESSAERLVRLDLFWAGRVVQRLVCSPRGEVRAYPLDHWDNFLMPEYQETWAQHRRRWSLARGPGCR